MEKLHNLRQQIDLLDQELLALLEKRAALSLEIGQIKHHLSTTGRVEEREQQVLDNLMAQNPQLLSKQELNNIYQQIFDASLRIQQQ